MNVFYVSGPVTISQETFDSESADGQLPQEIILDVIETGSDIDTGENSDVHTQQGNNESIQKGHICSVCGKGFAKKNQLLIHMRTHTGEKPFRCTLCGVSLSGLTSLQRHTARHYGVKAYECGTCGKSFVLKVSVREHEKTVHGSKEALKTNRCDFCEKSFRFPFQLRNHRRIHTGERPVECPECGLKFRSRNRLAAHQKRVHLQVKKYQCFYCGKQFLDVTGKNNHEMIHTGEKPFKCDQCDTSFRSRSHLNRHVVRIHSGVKSFKCDQCEKIFALKSELNQHNKVKHGPMEAVLLCKCDLCEKAFRYPSELETHKKLHEEKPFECTICGSRHKTDKLLATHQKYIHVLKKKHKCSFCGKRFTNMTEKNEHVKIHKDAEELPADDSKVNKSYSCVTCDRVFALKISRDMHVKFVHGHDGEM